MASHTSNGKTEGRSQSCAQCCMEEGMGAAGRRHRHPRLPGSQGRPPREGEGARAFSRPVHCSFPRFFTKGLVRGPVPWETDRQSENTLHSAGTCRHPGLLLLCSEEAPPA